MSAAAGLNSLPAPIRPAACQLGVTSVSPLGRGGVSFLLRTGSRAVVVKRLQPPRGLRPSRAVFDRLAAEPSPICPRLLDAVGGHEGCWYGLFEYVERVR